MEEKVEIYIEGCKKGERLILIGGFLFLIVELGLLFLGLIIRINDGVTSGVPMYIIQWIIRVSLTILGYVFIYRGSKIIKDILVFLLVISLVLSLYYLMIYLIAFYMLFVLVLLLNIYLLVFSKDVKEMFRIKQNIKPNIRMNKVQLNNKNNKQSTKGSISILIGIFNVLLSIALYWALHSYIEGNYFEFISLQVRIINIGGGIELLTKPLGLLFGFWGIFERNVKKTNVKYGIILNIITIIWSIVLFAGFVI